MSFSRFAYPWRASYHHTWDEPRSWKRPAPTTFVCPWHASYSHTWDEPGSRKRPAPTTWDGACPAEIALPPAQSGRKMWDYRRQGCRTRKLTKPELQIRLAYEAANKGKAKQQGGRSAEPILNFHLDVVCTMAEFQKAVKQIGYHWHAVRKEARANSVQGCLQLPVAARR